MSNSGESLHSLTIRLEALARLDEERDRLYAERHDASQEAIKAALLAVREQTSASFTASEKAIVKAEAAQLAYNQAHNDLARKMDDQYSHMMPRTEATSQVLSVSGKVEEMRRDTRRELDGLRQEIVQMRESISASGGRLAGASALWGYIVGVAGILTAVIAVLAR